MNLVLAMRPKPPPAPPVVVPAGAATVVDEDAAELAVPPQPAASTTKTISTGTARRVRGHRLMELIEPRKPKNRVTTG